MSMYIYVYFSFLSEEFCNDNEYLSKNGQILLELNG